MKNSLKEDTRACSFDVNSAARRYEDGYFRMLALGTQVHRTESKLLLEHGITASRKEYDARKA